ncbi:defensin-like [Anastrepha ludens]|uniref:defensin-like n=1 Tax=Anastrepha ludens TaxID=28586 RepID=UPI0023AF1B90|nr:defensin-like [Anastrepha ludens]
MKITVLILGLIWMFCLFAGTYAESTEGDCGEEEETTIQPNTLISESTLGLRRQKRFTCDLLSGFGFGHSACAAHCALRGNRGGYCNDKAVCVCRN